MPWNRADGGTETDRPDRPAESRRLIFDVGMCNGDDTAYYLHKGYDVVAIDADPHATDQAQTRFRREVSEGRLTILNVGIGPGAERTTFWVCEAHRDFSSFSKEAATRFGHRVTPVTVDVVRMQTIFEEFGVPFYLKVDIEGHDIFCLADIDPARSPRYVSSELSCLDIITTLRDKGYSHFKCIDQSKHRQLVIRPRQWRGLLRQAGQRGVDGAALVRRVASASRRVWPRITDTDERAQIWRFAAGSSGPFGEDTDGVWRTYEEACFDWLGFKLGHSHYGPSGREPAWLDVHAKRG